MISVIIPVYNTVPYLNRCVQSVIDQTYKDWECILVNDGSTDESGQVCEKWALYDSRIKVIHQKNRGVSIARNHGIENSRGEYICFIDSDDWVGPSYLEDMIFQMNEGVDLISTGTIHILSNGERIFYQWNETQIIRLEASFTKPFIDMIGLFYGPTAKLFKSQIIRDFSIKFPENFSLGEDLMFNFDYLNHIGSICCLPISNYYYYVFDGSLSKRFRDNTFDIMYFQWKLQKTFLQTKGMWNQYSQEHFYKNLWGIVYDSIFSCRKISVDRIREIVNIPEIDLLADWQKSFDCSLWIKKLIINRLYFILYMITWIK